MKGQRIVAADLVLLRADDPVNPMTVTGVLMFATPVDRARFVELIEDRLLHVERFRQRAVEDPRHPGRFYWQEDLHFDLDYHLQTATLPAPGDQAALETFVSDLASTQLDLSRPLWQLHLVEHYGPGSALICRLHHGMADGMALVQALLSLADLEPGAAAPAEKRQPPTGPDAAGGKAQGPAVRRGHRRSLGFRAAGRAVQLGRSLRHPRATVRKARSQAANLVNSGSAAATTLARLLLYAPEPQTPFKGTLTGRKRAAWSALVPVPDVKLIGRRLGGTVNDVLIAALTGALRRYLLDRGATLNGAGLRAAVPVNMRSDPGDSQIGNNIGFVFLPLPTGETEPLASLATVKRDMDSLKSSMEPVVIKALFQILAETPPALQDVLFEILGSKVTALVTNVMGPTEPIYLAGARLESVLVWVPQTAGVSLGISMLSYAGQVRLGVVSDAALVPDPEAIVAGFEAELATLMAIAASQPEPSTVKGMLATLDGTLGTIDAILANDRQVKGTTRRCEALTRTGQQCKNPALPDANHCRVHAHLEATTQEQKRQQALAEAEHG